MTARKSLATITDCMSYISELERMNTRLERDNRILSLMNENAERLREAYQQEKRIQYLYNDLLLKFCPNMILLFNNSLELVLCTESCLSMFGFKAKQDVYHKPFHSIFYKSLAHEWVQATSLLCAQCIEEQEFKQYTQRINTVDGNYFDAQISISPILTAEEGCAGEHCMGLVLSITDTTEFILMKEKAEAAGKSKSDFLANMSHEIRTPMHAIKGLGELLLMSNLTGSQLDYARNIMLSANSLLHIVNDVLDFSKIEANKIELVVKSYSLESLLNELVNIIGIRVAEKKLSLFCDIDPAIPALLAGDADRIKQVFLNLMSNAVKYTPQGHVKIIVTGGNVTDSTVDLIFKVQDTGIGLKKENMDTLFDAFTRFDIEHHSSITGTGLGLAIVHRLVQTMNGSITVESEYGEGSVFTVCLPQGIVDGRPLAHVDDPSGYDVLIVGNREWAEEAAGMLASLGVAYDICETRQKVASCNASNHTHCLVHADDSLHRLLPAALMESGLKFIVVKKIHNVLEFDYPGSVTFLDPLRVTDLAAALTSKGNTDVPTAGAQEGSIFFKGAKVLVVDDNFINLTVGEELLRSYGIIAATVESGEKAIELCRQIPFDLIFMDHMMPGMDGIETTSHIQEGPLNRQTPIVALTANVVSGMKEQYIKNGMVDFISKPIEMTELERVLRYFLAAKINASPSAVT